MVKLQWRKQGDIKDNYSPCKNKNKGGTGKEIVPVIASPR